ncbi:hypothetical protein E2C01_007594 [Portunus trituberculatus]|uniref:Uncharacterized protein n=1 Tax=Portunus trituberculatus TaxID=210409 RepID=A0A5B7CZN3_PORTR|nr:hypothetical protein [Portunus trituberculatus]
MIILVEDIVLGSMKINKGGPNTPRLTPTSCLLHIDSVISNHDNSKRDGCCCLVAMTTETPSGATSRPSFLLLACVLLAVDFTLIFTRTQYLERLFVAV